jgi:hypothetical protein
MPALLRQTLAHYNTSGWWPAYAMGVLGLHVPAYSGPLQITYYQKMGPQLTQKPNIDRTKYRQVLVASGMWPCSSYTDTEYRLAPRKGVPVRTHATNMLLTLAWNN